jgi:hypothetical protein
MRDKQSGAFFVCIRRIIQLTLRGSEYTAAQSGESTSAE